MAAGLGALAAIKAVGEGSPYLVSGLALVDANIWIDGEVAKRTDEAVREDGQLEWRGDPKVLRQMSAQRGNHNGQYSWCPE